MRCDQARVGFGVLADDEERRLDMLGLEDVEDRRRPFGIGAVVEGQRDLAFAPAPTVWIT